LGRVRRSPDSHVRSTPLGSVYVILTVVNKPLANTEIFFQLKRVQLLYFCDSGVSLAPEKSMCGSERLNTYFFSVAHLASLLSRGSVLTTLELAEALSVEVIVVVCCWTAWVAGWCRAM
jgi:hypothetical protein